MDHHLEIVKTNIKYPIVFYNHQFNKSRPVSSHYHQDIEVVYVVSGKVEAYIDGKKELREINMEFRAGYISEISILSRGNVYY